jgi:hypothetical protein
MKVLNLLRSSFLATSNNDKIATGSLRKLFVLVTHVHHAVIVGIYVVRSIGQLVLLFMPVCLAKIDRCQGSGAVRSARGTPECYNDITQPQNRLKGNLRGIWKAVKH